jgi:hypothetical protein
MMSLLGSTYGDTIVVGAPHEDSSTKQVNGDENNENAQDAGAAYVFVRAGDAWTQQAYLKANNAGKADYYFGWSVSISGDTIVVGAMGEVSSAREVNGDQQQCKGCGSGICIRERWNYMDSRSLSQSQ